MRRGAAPVQAFSRVTPRLNRLEHWYPFVRAAMCGPMRDMSANVAVLDLLRGAPAIYMLSLIHISEPTRPY